jgi:hypothetical protein
MYGVQVCLQTAELSLPGSASVHVPLAVSAQAVHLVFTGSSIIIAMNQPLNFRTRRVRNAREPPILSVFSAPPAASTASAATFCNRRFFMFSDRRPGLDITYIGGDGTGKKARNSIEDGDSVALSLEGESVLVRDVSTIYPGKYSGVVYGFEPSKATAFGGLRVGDIINFSASHVLLCRGD